jgi:hypothetical protein
MKRAAAVENAEAPPSCTTRCRRRVAMAMKHWVADVAVLVVTMLYMGLVVLDMLKPASWTAKAGDWSLAVDARVLPVRARHPPLLLQIKCS